MGGRNKDKGPYRSVYLMEVSVGTESHPKTPCIRLCLYTLNRCKFTFSLYFCTSLYVHATQRSVYKSIWQRREGVGVSLMRDGSICDYGKTSSLSPPLLYNFYLIHEGFVTQQVFSDISPCLPLFLALNRLKLKPKRTREGVIGGGGVSLLLNIL